MKRTDYETLAMEEIIVEMENGFLEVSANVQNPNKDYARIENQTINTGFSADTDNEGFANIGSWDNNN